MRIWEQFSLHTHPSLPPFPSIVQGHERPISQRRKKEKSSRTILKTVFSLVLLFLICFPISEFPLLVFPPWLVFHTENKIGAPKKIKQDFPTSYLGKEKRRSWGLDLLSASVSHSQTGRPRMRMSTPGDRRILNSVVNPLLPIGEAVYDDQEEEEQQQQVGKGFKNCSCCFVE